MNDTIAFGKSEIAVGFVNGAEDADIWILPQTDENLNTMLWGTPTLRGLPKGSSGVCRLDGGTEKFIVRIIDKDEAYFAAQDLFLKDGCTVRFTTDTDKYDASITVLNRNGAVIYAADAVFEGVLG